MIGGKRELLSRGLFWSGATFVMGRLPARDSLLVLNYHRIGNPDEDPFDPDIFSATANELDEQVARLKSRLHVVTLEEAAAFVNGTHRDRTPRCRALITFDDGYLDNFEVAFPILRSHGVQGVFFLTTGIVGSCFVPWWDRIAFLAKTARRRRFVLRYPVELSVDLDRDGIADGLRAILGAYKRPENRDRDRFMDEFREAANGDDPPATVRRFLAWDEAREMLGAGMAIGSHTHSHPVLSQIDPQEQRREFETSSRLLYENLGVDPRAIAYPVGAENSFTAETQNIARASGYEIAFSFYGGTNVPGRMDPYNIRRIAVGAQSHTRFSVQCAVCRVSAKYWP